MAVCCICRVSALLKPHLTSKKIDKSQYKTICKKCVAEKASPSDGCAHLFAVLAFLFSAHLFNLPAEHPLVDLELGFDFRAQLLFVGGAERHAAASTSEAKLKNNLQKKQKLRTQFTSEHAMK